MGERLSFPWTPHGLNAERTCVSAARTCYGGLLRSVAPSFIFCYASERAMRHRRSSSKLASTRVFAQLDHVIKASSCLVLNIVKPISYELGGRPADDKCSPMIYLRWSWLKLVVESSMPQRPSES